MRRLFVGDIHGCLGAFERLLAAADFQPGVDVLHPVGDLVAKGSDSLDVVRRCVTLGAEGILGNHDLSWLAKGRFDDLPELREFLAAWPVVRRIEDIDALMVHAGLLPTWGAAELADLIEHGRDSDFARDAVSLRYCTNAGERPASDWPPPDSPFLPWDDHVQTAQWADQGRIVFGHWARRGFSDRPHALGLDSGCVYCGTLTGWLVEPSRDTLGEVLMVHEDGREPTRFAPSPRP